MSIIIKTEEEIKNMREGGKRLFEILQSLKKILETQKIDGISLNKKAEEMAEKLGGTPAFKNYNGFPAGLCVSVNDAVVHGIPNGEQFKEGDLVKIDFGLWYKDVCLDSAITVGVGEISEEDKQLMQVTKECLDIGIKQAQIGNLTGDLGFEVQAHAEKYGYGVVKDLVGHGVGREVHEEPHVPNFGKKGKGVSFKDGMTIAIEPMINGGTDAVYMDKDGWTVRTRDGKNAAHFEHTVAITHGGPVVLTTE